MSLLGLTFCTERAGLPGNGVVPLICRPVIVLCVLSHEHVAGQPQLKNLGWFHPEGKAVILEGTPAVVLTATEVPVHTEVVEPVSACPGMETGSAAVNVPLRTLAGIESFT